MSGLRAYGGCMLLGGGSGGEREQGEWLARPACGGGSLGSFRGLHCYQLKESPCGNGKLPEVPLLELGSPDCQGLMRHS